MKRSWALGVVGSGLFVLVGLSVVLRRPRGEEAGIRRTLHSGHDQPRDSALAENPAQASEAVAEGLAAQGKDSRKMPGEGDRRLLTRGQLPDLESRRALRHAEKDFWEDLGALLEVRRTVDPAKYRAKVSTMTAEYLGLDVVRKAQFDSIAARATEELDQAWKIRNDAVVALPQELAGSERAEKEQQIQERYEEAKGKALGPMDSFLGDSHRHEYFRKKLGEWIDAVR
jgi:hypothetical protein